MTPNVRPIFHFENVSVREMVNSHSVLGLVIRLNFPYLHLSFIVRWNVNGNRCRLLFSQQDLLCVCLHTCLRINIHLGLTLISPVTIPLLKFVQSSLFAFPDEFLPLF